MMRHRHHHPLARMGMKDLILQAHRLQIMRAPKDHLPTPLPKVLVVQTSPLAATGAVLDVVDGEVAAAEAIVVGITTAAHHLAVGPPATST